MDPRTVWLSRNFRLSDFLGNHSVYAKGLRNSYFGITDRHLENATALCEHALEPLLQLCGPVSISYGYISPEFSRATVRYQDPDKPSHHRWDLGAAADVVSHDWVTESSPIELAHRIEDDRVPYSRMITYSESPFICLAVSAREVKEGAIRRAFYENRYLGAPREKPRYLSYASPSAKRAAKVALEREGLPVDWRGAGYPTYHGGGFRQYQHTPAGRYSTVLDWLFNLRSISEGIRNPPNLDIPDIQDAFVAAGVLYDYIVGTIFAGSRVPILQGFVSRPHPDFCEAISWFDGRVRFEVGAPQGCSSLSFCKRLQGIESEYCSVSATEHGAFIDADISCVIDDFFPSDDD